MTQDNEQIVRQAYQVAEEKDLKGRVNAFTADGTFTDNSIGVVYRGPDGPNGLPVQVENGAADWGQRMDTPCCDVFELADGKIKRFDCYPEGSIILTSSA